MAKIVNYYDYLNENITGREAFKVAYLCLQRWYYDSNNEYLLFLFSSFDIDSALQEDWAFSIIDLLEYRKLGLANTNFIFTCMKSDFLDRENIRQEKLYEALEKFNDPNVKQFHGFVKPRGAGPSVDEEGREAEDYMDMKITGKEAFKLFIICLKRWHRISHDPCAFDLINNLEKDYLLQEDWVLSLKEMILGRKNGIYNYVYRTMDMFPAGTFDTK